jgi:hypothetical protein
MWSIEIPGTNLKRVENWAQSLGFELVEPTWDAVLASVPEAVNTENGSFIYTTRYPIITRLRAPHLSASADVSLKSGSSRQSNTVSALRDSNTAFLSISVPWTSSNELVVDYDDRATLPFETRDPLSISDLKQMLSGNLALRLKIAETVILSWSNPIDVPLPRAGGELPGVEILPHLDDLRLNIEWKGETEGSRDGLTPEVTLRLIRSLIEDHKNVHVQVDAGGLGRLSFSLYPREKKKEPSKFARRAEWLSAAIRSFTPSNGVMLPPAAIRKAANFGSRLRSAAAKCADPRWRAVMLRTLKDQTG